MRCLHLLNIHKKEPQQKLELDISLPSSTFSYSEVTSQSPDFYRIGLQQHTSLTDIVEFVLDNTTTPFLNSNIDANQVAYAFSSKFFNESISSPPTVNGNALERLRGRYA